MSSTRQKKYEGLIQKDLSEIFLKDSRHWFGKAFITVTGCDISPDLSFVKVFLSTMMVEDQHAFVEAVNAKKGEIRKALGTKIGKQVRIIPDLTFYLDETMSNAQKMENLLSGLNIPPSEEENSGD